MSALTNATMTVTDEHTNKREGEDANNEQAAGREGEAQRRREERRS